MIRCFKAKRPVFLSVSFMNTHEKTFHLAPKPLSRSVLRKNKRHRAEEKPFENVQNPIAPEISNVNFFGIENEEGVITINSKISSVQEKSMKGKLKEKFYRTSFGVIRYDSDNTLKYHGQYGNRNDFAFPHHSNDYSEVSGNFTKVPSGTFDATCNNSDQNYNLNCAESSKIMESEIHSNERIEENSDQNSSLKENQKENYIDQYFFKNFSKERDDADLTVSNPSSTEELNFFDKEYFGHCIASENQISSQEQEFSRNTLLSSEANTEYRYQNFSTESSEERLSRHSRSNYTEGGKIHPLQKNFESVSKYDSREDSCQDILHNQVNDNESFDKKQINVEKSHNYMKLNQLQNEVFQSNNKLHTNSVVNGTFLSQETHSVLEGNTQIYDKSNKQSVNHSAKNSFPKIMKPFENQKSTKHSELDSEESVNIENVTTAYDFVRNLQKQQEIPVQNKKEVGNKVLDMKLDSKGFRILKNQVDDLSHFTRDEIISLLKQNILYLDDDLLILNKPYSLIIHDSQTTKSPCLSTFLEDLAKEIDNKNSNSNLVAVHRLDKETTGCLLIARNETMAQNLQSLFAQRKIIKKYWVLTSRVPNPPEGLIDIPIAEGSVANKKRMVLHPEISKDIVYRNHSKRGKQALTSYKVLSESGNAALVEATPITGIKHQIRVHFGFGLSCPIIGDHKYSHLDKLAPQKLPSDILQRLQVRQSKVRYVPQHIHAKSVTIPGYFEKQDLYVQAPLPKHMRENLKKLRFKK